MTTDQPADVAQQERDIAATRADMGSTLEAIEDRVSPSRIRQRSTERMRSRWQRMRQSVMGGAHGGASEGRVGQMAGDAQDVVQHAPERIEEATRGNPLAAGLIAFGVGALAGSLVPASRAEQELSTELRDQFEEPIRGELQQAGHEMADNLRGHAEEAVDETRAAAQQSMQRMRDDVQR